MIEADDYPQFIAGAVRDGAAPFVLAAPDGGNGYCHPHADDDPLGMLVVQIGTGCHDNRFWAYAAPGQVQAISITLAA